jgi:hypothetical protein
MIIINIFGKKLAFFAQNFIITLWGFFRKTPIFSPKVGKNRGIFLSYVALTPDAKDCQHHPSV